jgi:hypothetical protein
VPGSPPTKRADADGSGGTGRMGEGMCREGRGRTRDAGCGGVPRGSVAGPSAGAGAAQEARRAAMDGGREDLFPSLVCSLVCGGGGAEESNGMGGVRGLRCVGGWAGHVATHAAAIPGQPAPN